MHPVRANQNCLFPMEHVHLVARVAACGKSLLNGHRGTEATARIGTSGSLARSPGLRYRAHRRHRQTGPLSISSQCLDCVRRIRGHGPFVVRGNEQLEHNDTQRDQEYLKLLPQIQSIQADVQKILQMSPSQIADDNKRFDVVNGWASAPTFHSAPNSTSIREPTMGGWKESENICLIWTHD
jgi:hypothetical protein